MTTPISGDRALDGIPIAWGNVPLPNVHFTGRNALLADLHDQILSQGAAVLSDTQPGNAMVPRALQGLGGVGKTQLATEYAHRYRHEYDVVWWIPADQEALIPGSLAGLAPYLAPASSTSGNVEDTATAVLDALRRGTPYSRWLLIFDSADLPDGIMKFLLADGPGHTIITSRNPDWANVVNTIRVDVFAPQESRDFLRKRLPNIGQDESEQLADALGHLPIALEQAAALQARTGMSVAEYLELLDRQPSPLLSQGRAAEYPVPVTATWSLSIARLKSENPEAVDLLRCCAFFGPRPIPRDVLSQSRGATGSPLDAILADPMRLTQAIGGLGRYSLAQVDTSARTIQVHRLIQATVRDELSDGQQHRFRQAVHRLLNVATPTDPDDSSGWRRYAELLGHYEPAGIVASPDGQVRQLVRNVVRYLYMIGSFEAALKLANQAKERWAADPAADPRDLLAIKRHTGDILRATARYREAFKLNAEVMTEAETKLGPEDAETLLVTNSHGADLRAAGDFAGAHSLDEDSVARHLNAFGHSDRRTLRAQNNLAVDLTLLGKYADATSLHESVYQTGRIVYGSPTHPSVLMSLLNLGCAVRLSGRYADACMLAEDTYASCHGNLGPSHPITLFSATDLAIALRQSIGGTEALPRVTDLLALHGGLRGERHPEALAAALVRANTLRGAGQIDGAADLVARSLDIYRDVLGPGHPYTLGCTCAMAVLRRLDGDAEASRALNETAFQTLKSELGDDHPYCLCCAIGFASDMAALGEHARAKDLGADTEARLVATLGGDHPITLTCVTNLAADLAALGDDDAAHAKRASAMAALERTLGADHFLTMAATAGQRLECDFDPPPT